jgi:hypothetical protein
MHLSAPSPTIPFDDSDVLTLCQHQLDNKIKQLHNLLPIVSKCFLLCHNFKLMIIANIFVGFAVPIAYNAIHSFFMQQYFSLSVDYCLQ